MNFSEFAKMLYSYIGEGQEYIEYVLPLIDLIMEAPVSEKILRKAKMMDIIQGGIK